MAEVEVVAEVDPNNDYHVVTDPESRPWAIDFPNPPNNPLMDPVLQMGKVKLTEVQ